jgi:hypothetical protein
MTKDRNLFEIDPRPESELPPRSAVADLLDQCLLAEEGQSGRAFMRALPQVRQLVAAQKSPTLTLSANTRRPF